MSVEQSAQSIADALAPAPSIPSARWRWGTVKSVNDSGTMNVEVGGAVMPSIRCAQHVMGANVGDRVRVMFLGTEAIVDAVRATEAMASIPTIDGEVDDTSKTAWRTALAPDVLYEHAFPTGTGVTAAATSITLSASAADYSYLRIIYTNNAELYSSVEVYQPNGKSVVLSILTGSQTGTSTIWLKGSTWQISGTSMTKVAEKTLDIANGGAANNVAATNQIHVLRVEAW